MLEAVLRDNKLIDHVELQDLLSLCSTSKAWRQELESLFKISKLDVPVGKFALRYLIFANGGRQDTFRARDVPVCAQILETLLASVRQVDDLAPHPIICYFGVEGDPLASQSELIAAMSKRPRTIWIRDQGWYGRVLKLGNIVRWPTSDLQTFCQRNKS